MVRECGPVVLQSHVKFSRKGDERLEGGERNQSHKELSWGEVFNDDAREQVVMGELDGTQVASDAQPEGIYCSETDDYYLHHN